MTFMHFVAVIVPWYIYAFGVVCAFVFEMELINRESPVAHQFPVGTSYRAAKLILSIIVSMAFSWYSVWYMFKRCKEEDQTFSFSA